MLNFEIVPRTAIAVIARCLYSEPYVSLSMKHDSDGDAGGIRNIRYEWTSRGLTNCFIAVRTEAASQDPAPGSHEEFITEHYWGYTARSGGRVSEYEVRHPRWTHHPPRTTSNAMSRDCTAPRSSRRSQAGQHRSFSPTGRRSRLWPAVDSI